MGKTFLARHLKEGHECINFDNAASRIRLKEQSWDRSKPLLVLDEIHKMRNWKRFLKGIFDVDGLNPPILVTGSAKLDAYRKVGDSLAGRYFRFHLHPLDLRELAQIGKLKDPEQTLRRIMSVGGFPEPYLDGTSAFYNRWTKTHLDIILRQDLLDLASVREIHRIETLIALLAQLVGSPISYRSLAEDLDVDDKTVKRWLLLLEHLFLIFKVSPHHKNIARATKKSPKYYFFDTGRVDGDDGARLENAVACALLKEVDFRSDCLGEDWALSYLRTREGREVDFALIRRGKLERLIEVKASEDSLSEGLRYFKKLLPQAHCIQLVLSLHAEKTFPDGSEIRNAAQWLSKMPW